MYVCVCVFVSEQSTQIIVYCDLQNIWESLRRSYSSKLVQISRWIPLKIPIYLYVYDINRRPYGIDCAMWVFCSHSQCVCFKSSTYGNQQRHARASTVRRLHFIVSTNMIPRLTLSYFVTRVCLAFCTKCSSNASSILYEFGVHLLARIPFKPF
jgi:hypothetical protein